MKMPLNLTREYRNLDLMPADGEYRVDGYATTFDAPYLLWEDGDRKYYERVDRNALDGADISDVIFQYDHQGKVFARRSNGTLTLDTDDHGLHITADLSGSQAGRELYEEIKAGLITRMSWGFVVADDDFDRETRTRTIHKIKKVYDVSAVSIPANDDTIITARNAISGVLESIARESREREINRIKLKMKLGGIN